MNPSGSLNPSPRTLEVESVASFDRLVTAGAETMQGRHVQSLRGRTRALDATLAAALHDHSIGDARLKRSSGTLLR